MYAGWCVQLVAVLREVKYLLIRNKEEIPKSASELFAQNDTLLMYVANVDLTVAWYNKIRETVLEVEYPIIEQQLQAIDQQLQQAEHSLDWQSQGEFTRTCHALPLLCCPLNDVMSGRRPWADERLGSPSPK